MTSRALDAALSYAQRGWSVVPVHTVDDAGRCSCSAPECVAPGRHPRVRWEDSQRDPATVDQIREWFSQWPDTNVGIVTGAVSRLAVIDIAPDAGGEETLAEATTDHGALAHTAEVAAGDGHRHLYFAYVSTHGHVLASGTLGPGLELEADGGFVVAPPSGHQSGRQSEWTTEPDPNDQPLGALAAWAYLRAGAEMAPSGSPTGDPPRTGTEQRDFAALWAALGVPLVGGDRFYPCPLHDDSSRSLHIDAEVCRWHCFSCHEGGGAARVRALVSERLGPDAAREATADAPIEMEPTTQAATWLQWPTLEPGGEQHVVGEAEHQDSLEVVAGGRTWHGAATPHVTATLLHTGGDAQHPRTVYVEVGGLEVGRLAAEDSAVFADILAELEGGLERATARARITGGWDRGREGRGWFGLELDVAQPPTRCTQKGPFLPAGPPVAVLGEEAHQEVLRSRMERSHAETPTAELSIDVDAQVAVLLDGEEIGHLGERKAERYRDLVLRINEAGFPATCVASVIEGRIKVEVYVLLPGPDTLERLLEAT